jgi:hypothetical protein
MVMPISCTKRMSAEFRRLGVAILECVQANAEGLPDAAPAPPQLRPETREKLRSELAARATPDKPSHIRRFVSQMTLLYPELKP